VHSSAGTGDIVGILFDDYGEQLSATLSLISKNQRGVLVLLRQGEKMEQILEKLQLIENKDHDMGIESTEQRDFGVGAQILSDLGIQKIQLISNHPKKRVGLIGYGLEIVDNIEV
jgi:3,4-dihydroxy 2-butanone 4-phosphate synthase/GTP cyclohydrolase II